MAAVRILVTGHKGYIGAVLVPMLLERGFEVAGLDIDLFRSGEFGEPLVDVPEIGKDLRDVGPADVEGFDSIVHLAALSNDPLGNLDPRLTDEINYRASVRLAQSAKEAGVARLVFSSSCSNYGAAGEALATEESELHPLTPYARSKVMVEAALRELASEHFSPVLLRNATAYGASPRLRCDLVVNNMVGWAFTTGRIVIKSDGTPWRPLMHVRDICAAFVAALEAPRHVVHNETFNIGRTDENYQVRHLAEMIAAAIPRTTIEYAPGGGADTRNYSVSFEKAARSLAGFAPQWTVRKGVDELIAAYARANLWVEDVEGARGSRMACLRQLLETGALDAGLRWVS